MELQDRRFATTLATVILGLAVEAMEAPWVTGSNLGVLVAAITLVVSVVVTLRGLEAATGLVTVQ